MTAAADGSAGGCDVDPAAGDAGADMVLGVAVAVPPPHSSVLATWRKRVGDPAAELVWPHVTLLPPTPVPLDRFEDVTAHLRAAAAARQPFTMHLSGTGTFRPTSPVVFVQVARGVADCEELEKLIRSGPLQRPLDFPYHPHVTVAHHVDDEALDEAYEGLAGFVARFRVQSIQLFCREADGRWRQDTEFPLGSAGNR
jgi:2'-5' RNA ligase